MKCKSRALDHCACLNSIVSQGQLHKCKKTLKFFALHEWPTDGVRPAGQVDGQKVEKPPFPRSLELIVFICHKMVFCLKSCSCQCHNGLLLPLVYSLCLCYNGAKYALHSHFCDNGTERVKLLTELLPNCTTSQRCLLVVYFC